MRRLRHRYGRSSAGFMPFSSWKELMAYARTGAPLYYQAPLNHRPVKLYDFKVNPRSIRIWPSGSRGRGRMRTADPFTADAGHLDRFRYPMSEDAGVAMA